MITPRVSELREEVISYSRTYRHLPLEIAERERLADRFWDELAENCDPTEKEFIQLTHGILVTPKVFYRTWKK